MEGLMIMLRGSFTNGFSSNLNTVKQRIFSNYFGIYTWRESLDQPIELWIRGFRGRFQFIFPDVEPDRDIWEVNSTNEGSNSKGILCTLCLRGWWFLRKPVFFFKIFISYLYFDTLIVRLPEKVQLERVFFGVTRERWWASSTWGRGVSHAKRWDWE